jgi:hypothetical protein
MTEEEMFALPFDEYIRYRTEFAIERAKTSGVIDIDYAFLSLLQAIWARDYQLMTGAWQALSTTT